MSALRKFLLSLFFGVSLFFLMGQDCFFFGFDDDNGFFDDDDDFFDDDDDFDDLFD